MLRRLVFEHSIPLAFDRCRASQQKSCWALQSAGFLANCGPNWSLEYHPPQTWMRNFFESWHARTSRCPQFPARIVRV